MVRLAPRYPVRLFELIEELDEESCSLAEIVRRVGAAAQGEGLIRPSPVHVRRLVAELRELRQDERELRAAQLEVLSKLLTSSSPDRWELERMIVRAEERIGERARGRATQLL